MSEYVGHELDLFALAHRWKARLRREISPYLEAPVLEVGAGFGATTAALRSAVAGSWTGLEPDPALARRLAERVELDCTARVGDLSTIPANERFRSILYVDVLEHIDDDRGEVSRALDHLEPGGRLIVLSPAHQWLYSPFDAAIGHHRRYSRARLLELVPQGTAVECARYLDAPGLALNLGNRLVSRQRLPTRGQILFWDRIVVPVARVLDPILGYRVGRSLLVVWRRGEVRRSAL